MRWSPSSHLKAGIDAVRGAKLRSFWTTLGIIIGVASVISIVAIGEGIKHQIGGQIHHLGTNIIVVKPAQLRTDSTKSDLLSGLNVGAPLTAKDVEAVSNLSGLAASAPLTITPGTVHGENGNYNSGFVIGTTPGLPSLLNQSLSSGVFLTNDDTGTNVAVLGSTVAQKLFNEDVPLGRSFNFHGQQFIVNGIFNQFQTLPLSGQVDFNKAIFIPNDIAESLTNSTAPTYEILARPAAGKKLAATISQIQAALASTHGSQSGFSVESSQQNQAANNNILDLLTGLIAGVAAISLLVGGIGIMNVMLVSVAERTHEIGIRKAVGATNHQILTQFLVESALMSLAGGVIGVILAFMIDIGIRIFSDLQPSISWQIVLIASSVSLLVGMVFGTVPAIKAARRDPIEALRSE